MSKLAELAGTIASQFQIGIGGTGLRRLRFKNGCTADLECNPTANRTLTLPDASGTIALVNNRQVGCVYLYTGLMGSNVGYFDDFDGKWVYLTLNSFRTIGNPSSGASIAASWTFNLFEHLWFYGDTKAPMLTSTGTPVNRSASIENDYNANYRITFPDFRGRVMAAAGTGSGLTARSKNDAIGTETHTLSSAEMPSHTHGVPTIGRSMMATGNNTAGVEYGDPSQGAGSPMTSTSAGSGNAHNNMQPTWFEHLIISAGAR